MIQRQSVASSRAQPCLERLAGPYVLHPRCPHDCVPRCRYLGIYRLSVEIRRTIHGGWIVEDSMDRAYRVWNIAWRYGRACLSDRLPGGHTSEDASPQRLYSRCVTKLRYFM